MSSAGSVERRFIKGFQIPYLNLNWFSVRSSAPVVLVFLAIVVVRDDS